MRNLAVLTFLTLDGIMQAPGRPDEDLSGGFEHGAWAQDHWGEVMEQVGQEAFAEPFDLLFGRSTYDTFAAHHPNSDDPGSIKLNNARKFVVTSNPDNLTWERSTPISGDVASEVAALKQQDGPLLQVLGSWRLIQELQSHDLIDELRLWTFPLMVGPGKSLFSQNTLATGWALTKTQTTQTGVVMSFYKRERDA